MPFLIYNQQLPVNSDLVVSFKKSFKILEDDKTTKYLILFNTTQLGKDVAWIFTTSIERDNIYDDILRKIDTIITLNNRK